MTRDLPLLDLTALRAYLEEHGVTVAGPLDGELISGGKSNLTFAVTDGVSEWVARRPPASGLTPSAHDVAREWRVTHALRDSAVPVAPAVVLCEDASVLGAPFAVTQYVHGQVVRTRSQLDAHPAAELEACAHELVRVLADLHSVDLDDVALEGFGRPDGFLERQVRLWWRQWTEVKSEDLPDASRLHDRLVSALPTTQGRIGIVHGDYRIDNTMLAVDDITKVLGGRRLGARDDRRRPDGCRPDVRLPAAGARRDPRGRGGLGERPAAVRRRAGREVLRRCAGWTSSTGRST